MLTPARSGLIAGGNFIVDTVIRINRFPEQDMLVDIMDETRANGGGPYNVLRDLRALGATFPLEAVGLIGEDENGAWIRRDCLHHDIDVWQLHAAPELTTSYTHVMTVAETGRRTFFHRRGANSHLDVHHFDFERTQAKILHLGYLMLLDRLDTMDGEGRTGASHVLQAAHEAGLTTAVDLVSVDHPSFAPTVTSALPWIDHLILNEVEAGQILDRQLRADDASAISAAARELLGMGVRQAVVIHTESGGVAATARGVDSLAALQLPAESCRGANGAGDAFAAGYLYALHEGWPMPERLRLAIGASAASLGDPSPSGGIRPMEECLSLFSCHPLRPWAKPAEEIAR